MFNELRKLIVVTLFFGNTSMHQHWQDTPPHYKKKPKQKHLNKLPRIEGNTLEQMHLPNNSCFKMVPEVMKTTQQRIH